MTKEELLSLHRHFIWADKFRNLFGQALTQPLPEQGQFVSEHLFFMSYWYSSLYVVIEGYRQLKCVDSVVDGLLASPNVEMLRRYRNGVDHYQTTYWDSRFTNYASGQGTAPWAHQVHLALGKYFLSEVDNAKAATKRSP